MKKLIIYMVLVCTTLLHAETLSLQSGWNLVGANSSLPIDELKIKVGETNLLVIQGQNKTYQKSYTDEGKGFLNSFTAFEKGRGYWIKVNSTVDVAYDKITYTTEEHIDLIAGWNLINPSSDLNISEITAQLGSNLEVIQGQNKTYQKAYVDEGKTFLNSFTKFEEPQGYWVKVVSDATLTFPAEATAPTITGTAKTETKQYETYHFFPETNDVNGDNLTFSITNKPSWAEFNSTTGALSGIPLEVGSSDNIIISVSDGSFRTALQPFSIEVIPAQNIANLFSRATISRYYWDDANGAKTNASYPALIDGDKNNTSYIKADDIPRSWVQIELVDSATVYRVNIYARDYAEQLNNALVYLLEKPIKDIETLDDSRKIGTLSGEYLNTLELNGTLSGKYLAINSKNNGWFALSEVEIYGTMPDAPYFLDKELYVVSKDELDEYQAVKAIDYQNDTLSYTIDSSDFTIDEHGLIKAVKELKDGYYSANITVSDGKNSTSKDIKMLLSSNMAYRYGEAIQGEAYSSSYKAKNAIDGNIDTLNHTTNDSRNSWLQIKLPQNSKVAQIDILNRQSDYSKDRLSGSKLYLLDVPFNGNFTNLEPIATLSGEKDWQSFTLQNLSSANYILIHNPSNYLHIAEVQAYGILPDTPNFIKGNLTVPIGSLNNIGDKVTNVEAVDYQGDNLTYQIIGDVPFAIDENGNIFVDGSLEVKSYEFDVKVNDGNNEATIHVTLTSNSNTKDLNEAKKDFDTKAAAFNSNSNVDELVDSYLNFAHFKAKDLYGNFMSESLDDAFWNFVQGDTYIKEGLYASRFPLNPYFAKNLADFRAKLAEENNSTLFNTYKNLFLGLAINAKERGIEEEAIFGDTNEHRTIDYSQLSHYEKKERVWRDEQRINDLGYGIGFGAFKYYLSLKYSLSFSEADTLWSVTSKLKQMSDDGIDIVNADYDTRLEYGLSFDGVNLYRLVSGVSRLDCTDTDNPCQRIQNWLDNNGSVSKSEFLANFSTYKNKVTGLINPRDNMATELSELMGLAPSKYRLMSFYDLAKWKISLDKRYPDPINFNDGEQNWPLFDASLAYNSVVNAYPWQLLALEQSAQKQECGYVKSRFFETDKAVLEASYPPNAVDGGGGARSRYITYGTYTWAYNEPEVWFRESAWSPYRTVYRILQDGGVCGRQSTLGQHVNECLNRPSIGVGQPGHRAWVGVYNHSSIANQYYAGVQQGISSKESVSTGMNTIYNRYTKGIRDRGLERFAGLVVGVSPASTGEHIFNQSMILQHIAKILEEKDAPAETVLKKAIEIAPTNVDAWYQLARYYASKDEPQKVIDLANEFMIKRDSFFLDDDKNRGGDNFEVIVGKVIAFIAQEAPSIQYGKGENAQVFKEKLWNYLDTYESNYRSYRTYGYQNRYLAQLYLLGREDESGFINEIEALFDRFLENTNSGGYADNYFKNVYWGDVNKTALFDTLQAKTDEAPISDAHRAKIYEKILGRGQGVELARVMVNDICLDSNLSKCQSLKSFELDAKELYIVTSNNVVGEDEEGDPTKRGEAAYSTLVVPVVDDTGKELDIKVRIAKVATTDGMEGKLLKINDPSAVATDKTKIVAWIDGGDNQIESGRIYTARHRIVLKVTKKIDYTYTYMGNVILNLKDLMMGNSTTITTENWSSQKFVDDSTSIYFVALNEEVGATKGVWASDGYNFLSINVVDENGVEKLMKFRAKNDSSWTMNSGLNADWDNTLHLEYNTDDNDLTSGVRYKSISPIAIDARMWHKGKKLFKRLYLGVDMVVE